MKKILIISPHYPPSNLAAVHRTRLFAAHLPEFGWEPIVLTVHEKYYEEQLDHNLVKLLPVNQRIEKVGAFKISRPRLIGDMGLRGFIQLFRKAKQIIIQEKVDFLFIPIPSFYGAILGRLLNKTTGIKYGIDYIDPWVHEFPGSKQIFSRHWFTTKISSLLEPFAVKNASLITGVAEGYYQGVLDRNPKLVKSCVVGAMPYGGELTDQQKVKELGLSSYVFKKNGKFQFIYAGALLPKAFTLLEALFSVIGSNKEAFKNIEFHFIGTGRFANNISGFSIKPLALKYGIWNEVVFETPQRIPYLDVLVHLDTADAVFILGSTEPHYTPSKTYQAVLSGKPIMAILHEDSSAVKVIRQTRAGVVFPISGLAGNTIIIEEFLAFFQQFQEFAKSFNSNQVDLAAFDEYSAVEVTRKLAGLIDKAVGR